MRLVWRSYLYFGSSFFLRTVLMCLSFEFVTLFSLGASFNTVVHNACLFNAVYLYISSFFSFSYIDLDL